MKKTILLGNTLDNATVPVKLDIDSLIDTRMLIEGNSGSGKSYLLRLLCERAAEHVPVIVLDLEGEFATLREKIDAILIGPDGDVPTDLRSAALLARTLAELGVSAIIDLYSLKIQQRREYVKLFLDSLINLPKELWRPMLIVIDECHKVCPEKGQGDNTATQSVIDLMSLGRKRGYAGIVATQRFSKLHNDVIAETNNVFIGRTWMDNDLKRAGDYLGLSNTGRQVLAQLQSGEFFAFGPALQPSGKFKFKSDKVATTHPKAGERYKIKAPKPSDAISQIVAQIEGLPEVVEQEKRDIKSIEEAAKKREAELQTQIFNLKESMRNLEKPQVVPKHIYPEEKLAELAEAIDAYFKPFSEFIGRSQLDANRIEQLVLSLREGAELPREPLTVESFKQKTNAQVEAAANAMFPAKRPFPPTSPQLLQSDHAPARPVVENDGDIKISGPQQTLLDTLRLFDSFGVTAVKRSNLAAFAGVSPKSSGFDKNLSTLRNHPSGAMVEYLPDSQIGLTTLGKSLAGQPTRQINGNEDLLDAWCQYISNPQEVLLRIIIEHRAGSIARPVLAGIAGVSPLSSGFDKNLSTLRSLGLIDYGPNKTVFATDLLFPFG